MEKYGFVYIWFDRKHKRYYIGMHWGTDNDGYISSSTWMMQAYKRRPQDFKRRILECVYTNRKDLYEREKYWLSFIEDDELKVRYYNLSKNVNDTWLNETNTKSRKEKMRTNHWSKNDNHSERIREAISKAHKDKPLTYIRTDHTRKLISENSKRLIDEGIIGMKGKQHSIETKKKMSQNNAMNDLNNRLKISEANKGQICLVNGSERKKAKPGSEKYKSLIELGFNPIND